MIRFACPLWAVSAFAIVFSCCSLALAVESELEDSLRFGIQGSISGGTALVGQRFGGTDGNGDVQVFDVGSTDWTLSTRLVDLLPSDTLSLGADFGAGALAIDGDTVIVGAYRNEVDEVSQAGSVFLFSRDGATWSYEAQWNEPLPLGATTPVTNAQFGIAGDLDGDHAIIVAGGTSQAYIYDRSGGNWGDGTMLEGGNINAPLSAAIDNQVAVVGTFLDGGHLDVWRKDGESWNHEAQIANPMAGTPGADNLFAATVDISGDTIVVAARGQTVVDLAEEEYSDAGAVYVYQYDDGTSEWILQQTIEHPEPAAGDAFGYDVAISGDKIVVGAPRQDIGSGEEALLDVGAAYVFERTDSTWTQIEKRGLGNLLAGRWFGETVSVDPWSMLIAGSGRTTVGPLGQGAVQLDGSEGVDIPGDANRDKVVDEHDAAILAQNWNDPVTGWDQGDFNGDGFVNAADAAILAANWGQTGEQASGAAVPEPNAIILLLGGLLMLAARGRRNG